MGLVLYRKYIGVVRVGALLAARFRFCALGLALRPQG